MRAIAICLLILVIIFLGHSIYDRNTADRLLTKSVQMLPLDPDESYRIIKEALDYNRLVALGKVGAVEDEYVKTLEQKFLAALRPKTDAPQAPIYPATERVITVLDLLSKQTGRNIRDLRIKLLKAARDSVPVLKEKGSLEAWDRMIAMFQDLGQNDTMIGDVFDNFPQWFKEVQAVPRRPLGLRDTVKTVRAEMNQFLSQIHLAAAGPSACDVAPAPRPTADGLSDNQLIDAERLLTQAMEATDNFQQMFKEDRITTELCHYRFILHYNKAAIKLAHFQDRKQTLYQTASDYIIEFLVKSGTSAESVPSPQELTGAFVSGAKSEFHNILDPPDGFLLRSNFYDDSMKRAYLALCQWTRSQLDTAFANNPPLTPAQMAALQAGADLTGPAAAIVQAMKQNSRALIIVRVP